MNLVSRLFVLAIVLVSLTASAHTGAPWVRVTLTCDFNVALKAGKYDWVHPGYKSATVPKGKCTDKAKVKLKFFQVNKKVVSIKDGLDEVSSHTGCSPARWQHLLALGAQHPKYQRHRHIVAIGDIWSYTTTKPRGMKLKAVPSLYWDKIDGRNLGFNATALSATFYIAAVCK